jgi:serine/threonine protein kinase/peptidoglycan hydrolase-like protein with peptidoglycan-binding domain
MTTGGQEELRGALAEGVKLRGYEIVGVLGHGGFGVTYRARDTTLGRDVAIKEYLPTSLALREDRTTVVPRSSAQAEEFIWGRERFLDEARTLAKLDRVPAIVRVYDFLEANGTAYMVMALAAGETLDRKMKREGRLSQAVLETLLYPLLDGLEAVHESGFLHRDIKPENIIVDAKGGPTLIDFGASRAAMAERTTAMTAIFTPGYAAAEQFTSARQGPWTDIYGLAATLYHAITVSPPPNAFERMLDDEYQPLAKLLPAGISPGFIIGIDAALMVRAVDRPQSIEGWRAILRQSSTPDALATVALGKPADTAATATVRLDSVALAKPTPKRARMWIGAGIAALALAGGGSYLVASLSPKPAAPTVAVAYAVDSREAQAARTAAEAADREKAEAQRTAEAQRKAEADEALRRQIAEEARRQIEADRAEQKRLEDEARQKAEAEAAAKQQAEEQAKAEAEAEAAARRAAEANDKKAAETNETALHLSPVDRQHIQVALTSLGFNTGGTDGVFGPRTRDMVAGWQKARDYAATGFMTAAENQALMKEAAAAISRFDDDQKKIEDDKKADEARKAAAVSVAPPASAKAPSAPEAADDAPLETKTVTATKVTEFSSNHHPCDDSATAEARIFRDRIELRFAGAWRLLRPDAQGRFSTGEFNSATSSYRFQITGTMTPRAFDIKNVKSGCTWHATL